MLPGRTTVASVSALLEGVDSSEDITQYIDPANELVTERCAVVFPGIMESLGSDGFPIYTRMSGGFSYSDHRLELIERWLAAHFYCVFNPRPVTERVKNIGETLQDKVDLGLDSSLYGQTAMRMDTQGALAVMNNAQKEYAQMPPALQRTAVGVAHLGNPPCVPPGYRSW